MTAYTKHQQVGAKKPKKVYKYKRKATGEAALFFTVWNTRPHVCVNCLAGLGNEAKAIYFSHIKNKKKFPELRLDINNIQLLCEACHYAYDFRGAKEFTDRTNLHKPI